MQTIGGREPMHGELGRFYDAIENPRKTRGELPILRDAELRSYMADVRERTLEVLDEVDISPDAEDPLLREGFVYEMLLAHELQHNETMLQLLQMVDGYESAPVDAALDREPPPARSGDGRDRRPASTRSAPPRAASPTTTSARRHAVELGAFEIDRLPVTNAAYAEFVEATGRRAAAVLGARRRGLGQHRDGPARAARPRPARRPRLLGGGRRLRPLGRQAAAERAGVGGGPAAAGGGRAGLGMDLLRLPRLPRLRGLPLPRVLRGLLRRRAQGAARRSWATHPDVVRPSFRNWDLPQRRQIFSGLRCARDA